MRVYVHLGHGLNVETYRQRFLEGRVPDESPYGFHHAEALGCELTYSKDAVESRLINVLRRGVQRVLGFDLIHAWRNRKAIAAADVVWTMEEIQYLAVCALPGVVPEMTRPRLIAQTVWLFNTWTELAAWRRWMLTRLLRRADRLTFHSKEYLPLVQKLVPGLEPELLYFGISEETFRMQERVLEQHSPLRVLSMGSDRTRDWGTLLAAFGNDDRVEVKVICSWLTDAQIGPYRNVECPRNPTMDEFREFYRWADVVVIPMVENLYSGITVALEAACQGVPIVSSETGGIPTYFGREEALFVRPADAVALREALLACSAAKLAEMAKRAQKRFRRDGYSTRAMAARYVALSKEILPE